jgi:AcrR family transcriptional regulator
LHSSTHVVATETRDRIVEAAANAFADVGFRFSTVRGIAAAARVNEITLYRYFTKKTELYWEAVDSSIRRAGVRDRFSETIANAHGPAELIQGLAEQISEIRHENPRLERLIYFTALELDAERKSLFRFHFVPLFAMLVERIRVWIESEVIRSVDPTMAANSILGVLFAHSNSMAMLGGGEDRVSDKTAAAEYASFCTDGLCMRLPAVIWLSSGFRPE